MTPAVRMFVALHGDDQPRVIPLPANLFGSCCECGRRMSAYVKGPNGKLVAFGDVKFVCLKCAEAIDRQQAQEAAMWAAKEP